MKKLLNPPIRCHECIYFERFREGNTLLGYCHSQSPILLPATGRKVGIFPIVTDACFCGDGVKAEFAIEEIREATLLRRMPKGVEDDEPF